MAGENGEFHRPNKAMGEDSIDNEEEPPTTSPYTTRAVTVNIGQGGAKYTVLQAIVDQYDGLKAYRLDPNNANAPIILREVDEEIGHTLIHYLYTGQYQTLALGSLPEEARIATEFKRSVLAYCAARMCGIEGLEEITKGKIEELSQELSIFDLQKVTEEVSTKLPRKGDWFSAQMNKWIKSALVANDTLLAEPRFLDVIGHSAVFDRAVVKGLTEMYGEQKAKHSTVGESEPDPEQQEPMSGSVKSGSVTATQDRPDSAKPNGIVTHGIPYHVKPQLPQDSPDMAANDLDETVTNETAGEYSPMPSPPGSPFETRRASIGKNEELPRPGNAVKGTDSELEPPKPKGKKGKKKNRKKSDSATVRQGHDDEPQIGAD